MQVKQLRDAKPYEAPNHRGYCSLRLFGLDAGGPKQFTVGLSYFLPGGGAGPDASPTEKVYYVLAGELTLITGGKETVLRADDSCFIGPNESREIVNHGNEVVTMLVAVSTPPK
jgi:quercetin dioxygenase-like cupin family protein